jgi:hypothetical protein
VTAEKVVTTEVPLRSLQAASQPSHQEVGSLALMLWSRGSSAAKSSLDAPSDNG